MLLTWDKGYADYADTANWNPRYDELCRLAQSVTVASARLFTDAELLETLEQLEELMRFYCVKNNMADLEPVMRIFNDLMALCRDRQISGVEVQYLQMLFLRVNAMLYRAHRQHKQGADSYDKCVQAAQTCFNLLRKTTHLHDQQIFFVAWSCIECWKEAAEAHDEIMDAPGMLRLMQEVIPMLEWVDKWLVDSPGICDQAAELYAACAGMFYQYGNTAGGSQCYRQAARLFNLLDETYHSDFYKARAIWMLCLHGTMAFLAGGDASLMLQCEKESAAYLIQRKTAELRDRAIVESAQTLIDLQKSTALQQNGKLAEAINLTKNAVAQLDVSLSILQDDYKDRQGYYRMVISNIATRIHNICLGSKETLGVMYYQDEDPAAAEVTLKEVLEELTSNTGPRLTGSAAVLIQSEVLQYLALIATQDGDVNQADFYATQSADLASSVANSTGNTNAWGLVIASSSLVAEIALALKNKTKAAQYAQLGLSACDTLARAVPNHPHLALRSTLEKFRKKANRRFF